MSTFNFGGIEIFCNPYLPAVVPRMKLKPGDYVSDEMRAKTDAWLLEFFGTEPFMLMTNAGQMFIHPDTNKWLQQKFTELKP